MSSRNGKNHFLVGQEMHGSIVTSCIEIKNPSGNRWFKIRREFKMKNGSQFWVDKLISREKGEETLADWLKEQAELKAKKEVSQAKAREMARLHMQAKNGSKNSKASEATTNSSIVPEIEKKMKPKGSMKDELSPDAKAETPEPKSPVKSKRAESPKKHRPSSLRNAVSEDNTVDVQKSPKSSKLRPRKAEDSDSVERKSKRSPAYKSKPGKGDGDDIVEKKPKSYKLKSGKSDDEHTVEKKPKKPSSYKVKTRKLDDDGSVEKKPKKPSSYKVRPTVVEDDETDVVKKPKKPRSEAFEKSPKRPALPEDEDKVRLEVEKRKQHKSAREEEANRDAGARTKLDTEEKATERKHKNDERKRVEKERKREETHRIKEAAITKRKTLEAEEKTRQKAQERALVDAEEKAHRDAEEEAQERARVDAEEKAHRDAEEDAKAQERARVDAEEKAHRDAEEDARIEAEKKTRRDAEEQADQEADKKARLEEENRRVIEESKRLADMTVKNDTNNNSLKEFIISDDSDHAEEESDTFKYLDSASHIAELSGGSAGSPPLKKKSSLTPYDEKLADSFGSRQGGSDSDTDTKKKKKKKRDGKAAKSDDASKRRKSKTKAEAEDLAEIGIDLDDASKATKKKKKKGKDTKKGKSSKPHPEDPTSLTDGGAADNNSKATKKRTKKKKKGIDKDAKEEEAKEAVVSNIHSLLEAMFDSPVKEEPTNMPGSNLGQFQEAQSNSLSRDDLSVGSAEFRVNPELMGNPLDDYSSDEPSEDSDDDFEYERVAGVNDFDNTGLGTSKRPSAIASKAVPKPAADVTDLKYTDSSDAAAFQEKFNFSSLNDVKDAFPTFSKIMGVWVDRENKLLYQTPLEIVDRRGAGEKEVEVQSVPETPTFGTMVKKWENKFLNDEPEKAEIAPRKLKNVWAEKLEFSKPFTKPSHQKSADEIKLIEDTVEKNFAFKDLTPDEMAPLVDAFERVEYEPGSTIGDYGAPERFYSIVQSGEVDFHVAGKKVGTAKTGDAFGELSLLYSVPRAAEATATESETVLFQLDQLNYRHILREQMMRSKEEKLHLLQSVDLFKNLEENDLRQLVSSMIPHKFKEGDNLSAAFMESPFCLVQEGSVVATDAQIGPGESFGQESLISKERLNYEVTATSDGLAFTIDRKSFEKVFGDFDRVSQKYRDKQILEKIRQIRAAKLEEDEIDTLVRQITDLTFSAGTEIFEFNEEMPPALYLVRSGRIKIVKKNGEEKIVEAGGYFGEEYMLFTSKQSKDIVPDFVVVKYSALALEETVCGVLTLQEVGIVSGRIQAIQDIESTQNIALEDLERHRVLGEGQFGVVWLVTVKTVETDPYALKIQYVDDPCRDDPAECIREEIRMMRAVQHPFIIQVVNTYEDEATISMLLSLAPGGELFDILHRQDVNGWWVSGLAEPIAKFYAMVVADTIAFMHNQKFVYRDLKPENVLIDKDGYPVLTDFGFVKKLEGEKTYTFCGTPNYVAPEVVMNVGHDTSADNWSLGVLIYELIDGANPFWEDGMDQQTLYELISFGLYPPISNKKCSRAGQDLLDRLLEKDPNKRLGSFREKDILEHKWFRDFDIKELRSRLIKAPWVPDSIGFEPDD